MSGYASTLRAPQAKSPKPWQAPSRPPRQATSEAAVIRRVRKNEPVFLGSDRALYLYRIVHGAVRTSRLLSDGRRQIDEFYLQGDVFGFEAGDEHQVTAEALEDTVVAVYYRREILEALRPPMLPSRVSWWRRLRNR